MPDPAFSEDPVLDNIADHAVVPLDPTGVITSWNRAAQRTTGYTAAEIVGGHFSVFYTNEDRQAGVPMQALQTAAATGRFQAEGWRVRKDGSRFWADGVIQPLIGGSSAGYVKVTRDMSERLVLGKLREELQQSQKLEIVGQLTGGIAHDFNNLLTAIESTFELIRHASNDARVTRYLGLNRIAVDRSRKLIGQLLTFSRKQASDSHPSNVNEVACVFDELLQNVVGPGIDVAWRLDDDVPLVDLDAGHLQSALMNLVINARDAMPNGGALTIFSELRHIEAETFEPPFDVPAGSYVVIGVTDTGVGMSKQVLSRCLEPFFTTKAVDKGTGLGLSQCLGFARESGGTLDIRSVEDVGTTVAIVLPVYTPAAEAAGRQRTVLLVEDDPAVRELAAELLRILGNVVIEASDAADALSHLRQDLSIDLLFTDIMMPNGMNGIELLKKAREIQPGLAAILTSGYMQNMLPGAANLPDNAPFLCKPYTLDDLRESLRANQTSLRMH